MLGKKIQEPLTIAVGGDNMFKLFIKIHATIKQIEANKRLKNIELIIEPHKADSITLNDLRTMMKIIKNNREICGKAVFYDEYFIARDLFYELSSKGIKTVTVQTVRNKVVIELK